MDADRQIAAAVVAQAALAGQQRNLAAFLMTVARCEGTVRADGARQYRALFGYQPVRDGPLFNGFAEHPNVRASFLQTDGTLGFTTAAGAYQFIFATWMRIQTKLALPDFSPSSQDLAATELISEKSALADAIEGRFRSALDKCASIWASLPASQYLQPRRTFDFARAAYADAGGLIA